MLKSALLYIATLIVIGLLLFAVLIVGLGTAGWMLLR